MDNKDKKSKRENVNMEWRNKPPVVIFDGKIMKDEADIFKTKEISSAIEDSLTNFSKIFAAISENVTDLKYQKFLGRISNKIIQEETEYLSDKITGELMGLFGKNNSNAVCSDKIETEKECKDHDMRNRFVSMGDCNSEDTADEDISIEVDIDKEIQYSKNNVYDMNLEEIVMMADEDSHINIEESKMLEDSCDSSEEDGSDLRARLMGMMADNIFTLEKRTQMYEGKNKKELMERLEEIGIREKKRKEAQEKIKKEIEDMGLSDGIGNICSTPGRDPNLFEKNPEEWFVKFKEEIERKKVIKEGESDSKKKSLKKAIKKTAKKKKSKKGYGIRFRN